MQHFVEDIKKNALEYGSIPFWSWNDKLEEEELRRQINVMHDMGMKGFFMHARGGLETEYLSEEWYDCIRACVDEAKKLGMAVLYLEVRESNQPARGLYKSLGFEENGIRKNFYEQPVENAVLMSKTL